MYSNIFVKHYLNEQNWATGIHWYLGKYELKTFVPLAHITLSYGANDFMQKNQPFNGAKGKMLFSMEGCRYR